MFEEAWLSLTVYHEKRTTDASAPADLQSRVFLNVLENLSPVAMALEFKSSPGRNPETLHSQVNKLQKIMLQHFTNVTGTDGADRANSYCSTGGRRSTSSSSSSRSSGSVVVVLVDAVAAAAAIVCHRAV